MTDVVIDAGHGGFRNVGGSSWNNAVGPNGTLEKTLTLKVATLLAAQLPDAELTRTTDVNISLAARARVAKSAKAKAFVSIHFNASRDGTAQGTETLIHTNYSSASAQLSLLVQDNLLQVTGLRDRNASFDPSRIKPMPLGVLNPSRHHFGTAACLAEVSFLDQAEEEQRLQEPAYLEDIAGAIGMGVKAFLQSPTASMVPVRLESEDAIDVVARQQDLTTVTYLNLDIAGPDQGDDAEQVERESSPKDLFGADFLSGSFHEDETRQLMAVDQDYMSEFTAFLAPLGLRYFKPSEVLFLGNSHGGSGRCGGLNSLPPKTLWNNVVSTVLMLDEIRHQLGAPIRVLSGYRNDAYNSCISGAANSYHKQFMAMDFTAAAGTPEIWRRIAARIRASDARYAGGIGKYISSNFVHIDTRGQNSDWTRP
ncbi:N-acetylmuramoyl-L-alanine amidase [uncultured Tateyamaria sp.]|uniref:N-acetylmuramoyl-L-alanine amidase n=1 Tax=uncultured Tateyamaria sp. TaxID=455651 RepID=UPI0026297838|nr:N-acetylmuramoyl-L-alanine amidase [uncultured Tateyamaria sp.]